MSDDTRKMVARQGYTAWVRMRYCRPIEYFYPVGEVFTVKTDGGLAEVSDSDGRYCLWDAGSLSTVFDELDVFEMVMNGDVT